MSPVSGGGGARAQVARLLDLAPYLQHREVNVAQVAADFGVTPAQVMRDLNVLYLCGLPGLTPDKMIEVNTETLEDDPEGIVQISNADYLERPVRLNSSEAAALLVALKALRESGTTAAAEVVDRALAKLEQATVGGLPAVEVHLDEAAEVSGVRAVLEEAIAADRQVRLSYFVPARDESTSRVVDPVAVGTREGHDYLDAWCHLAQDRRTFRVDRIEVAEVLESARATDGLDPVDLSAPYTPGESGTRARIELDPEARWVADYHPVEAVEELGGGRLGVDLLVEDPRWLLRLALRLSPHLSVVSPPELREHLVTTARAALILHDGPGSAA